MGYTVPLRFIKVSNKRSDNKQADVAICATRIVAIMSTEINQARNTIRDEKKAGTLINAAGIAKAQSAIFLDNGSVVSSPLRVNRLMSLIERSNEQAAANKTKRMRVFDVYDDDMDEDNVDDVGVCMDDSTAEDDDEEFDNDEDE